MARKSAPSAASGKRPKRTRSPIPKQCHVISSATIGADIQVPMLVLYGEWLKTIGFPIGSVTYLTADQHGEMALQRVGLRLPRRLRIRAMPR